MVGLVIFTHGAVGESLKACAEDFFKASDRLVALGLNREADRSQSWSRLHQAVEEVDDGSGVLVMVDMFGGTPSNLAMALLTREDISVVTGVNLPMVLRAVQKRAILSVHALGEEALAYGRRNVTSAAEWLQPEYTEEIPIGVKE